MDILDIIVVVIVGAVESHDEEGALTHSLTPQVRNRLREPFVYLG